MKMYKKGLVTAGAGIFLAVVLHQLLVSPPPPIARPNPDLSIQFHDMSLVTNMRAADLEPPSDHSKSGSSWAEISALYNSDKKITLQTREFELILINKNSIGSFADAIDTPFGLIEGWSECDKHECVGWIAKLKGSEESIRIENAVKLDVPKNVNVWYVNKVRIDSISTIRKWPTDDINAVAVEYSFDEPPRPALGQISHAFISVFNVVNMNKIFSHEVTRSGMKILKDAREESGLCVWKIAVFLSDHSKMSLTENCKYEDTACGRDTCLIKPIETSYFNWDQATQRFINTGRE